MNLWEDQERRREINEALDTFPVLTKHEPLQRANEEEAGLLASRGLAAIVIVSALVWASMDSLEITHDFYVTDSRYHNDPDAAEIYFASSDRDEVTRAANESGFNFLVIRGFYGVIIHDAALHQELPLDS